MDTPKTQPTKDTLKKIALMQAPRTVKGARATLERAQRGELNSVQPVYDAIRELNQLVDALAGIHEGAALRGEAVELLERYRELDRKLLGLLREAVANENGTAPKEA